MQKMQVLNASRRFLPKNPGLLQKLKVPKGVCRWTRVVFGSGPPFFAIFGPARAQIYGEKAEKIKTMQDLVPLGPLPGLRKISSRDQVGCASS